MRDIYKPTHFELRELVPPDVFKALGDQAWILIDPRIAWTLDAIRNKFGKAITVNNWHTGGPFSQRGFRNHDDVGAVYSQHRYGNAVDFDIEGMTAEQFRDDLKKNPNDPAYQYITACELGTNWIHIDVRPAFHGTGVLWVHP